MQQSIKSDIRGILLGMWIILGVGTLTSTLFLSAHESLWPGRLLDYQFLILGFWFGGFLAGLLIGLLGWPADLKGAMLTAVGVYLLMTLIRIFSIGAVLPGKEGWMVWQILTLGSASAYGSFKLLALGGGALLTALGVFAGSPIGQHNKDNRIKATPVGMILAFVFGRGASSLIKLADTLRGETHARGIQMPELPIRVLFMSALWATLLLMALVISSTLRYSSDYPRFALENVGWLTLPLVNMLIVVVVGVMVGGLYLCPNRLSAGLTVFLGLVIHVTFMMSLEGVLASYDSDPAFVTMGFNDPNIAHFFLFWFVTPLAGGIAAFAIHNLRDAFRLEYYADYDYESEFQEVIE